MRKLYGAIIILILSIPLIARQQNVNLVNLATDVFGILSANNLPVFGVPVDNVTGTTYAVACGTSLANSDNLHWKLFSNSGAIAVTIFKQTTCTYATNFAMQGSSTSGAGTITITPTTSQISLNGGAYGSSATIAPGQSFRLVSDISSSGCSTNGCWDLSTLSTSSTANTCIPQGSTLVDGSTVTWAVGTNMCSNAQLTFTVHSGSRTLNLTGMETNGNYNLTLIQDGTGGEGLTLGTGCTWRISGGGSGAITPSTGAGAVDILSWKYNGTDCDANFNKNFN